TTRAQAEVDRLDVTVRQAVARGQADADRLDTESLQRLASWRSELETLRAELESGINETAAERRQELDTAVSSADAAFERWALRSQQAEETLQRLTAAAAHHLSGILSAHQAELESVARQKSDEVTRVAEEQLASTEAASVDLRAQLEALLASADERVAQFTVRSDEFE